MGKRSDPAWAINLPIQGLSSYTARVTYYDLKITPGVRGMQLCYPSTSTSVTVRCNSTGFLFTLAGGPRVVFLPLYMLFDLIDLTITSGGAAFAATASALLLTEEQLPFTGT
jgi:hypothetical protein